MDVPPPPPPQDNDPIIAQFTPEQGQWELNDENIKRIDPETGHTILHNYCDYIKTTPLEVYRFLIETKGCDMNIQDKYKDIPLYYAFASFNPRDYELGDIITVLRYLLSHKNIDVNITNERGFTLFRIACSFINDFPFDIFKLLIEARGFDVKAQDNDPGILLHYAFLSFNPNKGGDLNVLLYLLSQKKIDVDLRGYNGQTLFHGACKDINKFPLDVFKALIETHGCNVNVRDNYNNTPLHCALEYFNPSEGGDINVLAYLISQKTVVNINAKYTKGYTLLHYACIINRPNTWYSAELNAKCDTNLCQLVEVIAERCLELVLDETTS
jgi:hypothetical protein